MTDDNKVWFITGISRGFRKALAEALLSEGDIVIGTTRDGKAPIEDSSGRLHTLALDVTDGNAIKAVVAQAHGLHDRVDVIVNNASYGLLGSIEEATDDQIENLFSVNFHGTRRVVQAALPYLRKQRSGYIVNITSIAGLAPGSGSGFYAASKFAVEGLSQSLAREVARLKSRLRLSSRGPSAPTSCRNIPFARAAGSAIMKNRRRDDEGPRKYGGQADRRSRARRSCDHRGRLFT